MLDPKLVDPILEKLGFRDVPSPDWAGLCSVYYHWSMSVPFDNIQKRLFYSGTAEGPIPGRTSDNFFRQWLAHGTGGTCWSNSHAIHDLLDAIGFPVERVAATMLSSPDAVGPTHGSVAATVEGLRYLVDGSMLTRRPVPFLDAALPHPVHPSERVSMEGRDGQWTVLWYPAHRPEGLVCRIEEIGVPLTRFNEYHERTRLRSNFNNALYIRQNRENGVDTIAFGERMKTLPGGAVERIPISHEEVAAALAEDFGISEELASLLPGDVPP